MVKDLLITGSTVGTLVVGKDCQQDSFLAQENGSAHLEFSPKNFKKLIYHFFFEHHVKFHRHYFRYLSFKKKGGPVIHPKQEQANRHSWSHLSGLRGSWRSAGFPAAT